jgi:phosphatidylserine decarboxylase
MVKNAWNFIVPAWVFALALVLEARQGHAWLYPLAGLAVLFSAFCAYFFRNPQRRIPEDPSALVSPADGKVIAIEPIEDPWLGQGVEIRIFLNVFNVHVQRSPFTQPSLVEGTRYFAGKFLAASVPKASIENEQHWFRLSSGGRKALVKQIAGLIARRIVPWSRPGDELQGGQLIGLIQFGSQVDLGLTPDAEILVKVGDRVVGGETVLARYAAPLAGEGKREKRKDREKREKLEKKLEKKARKRAKGAEDGRDQG